ncbi:Zinc finger RING-type [Arabidopsis thaliana x Arabidopsis arenosa]|uniref:RING-type E3 ubiquitin transferase n=1 Tax=Arabidopsis thaliana x Arabidopsis arenosa TaxID=1240361 RepID=A0A8T2AR57_9BRAS|nr:Zinc finger RING-type [Arabidopsis thaliana x Arabidopsis arenosa]
MSKPIRSDYNHKITHDPEPEDAGTIRINARVFREADILTYTTLSFPDELINDECQSKVVLIHLLKEAGMSDYDTAHMMYHFIGYVAEITSSASEGYSPGCALEVSLDLLLIDESYIEEAVKVSLEYEIKQDLEPEDAGTIRVDAMIISEDDILTFTTLSFANEFIINDDPDECRSKVDLNDFLKEAGISDHSIQLAMYQIDYVAQITSSTSNGYSPGCALQVSLDIFLRDDPHIEEAVQVSFDETTNICLGPASKLVVKSLIRKIYDKINYTGERCTICLEEFNNGGRLVALPCGHDFDDECAVKWFETNHVCPLCRYELPCEEEQ